VQQITSEEAAVAAARIAEDERAEDVVIRDVRRLTTLCDFFVLCNGQSDRHTRAVVDALIERLPRDTRPLRPLEGYQDARWILLDCGDIIIHIFSREGREFYQLERLWGDAPVLNGWRTSRTGFHPGC